MALAETKCGGGVRTKNPKKENSVRKEENSTDEFVVDMNFECDAPKYADLTDAGISPNSDECFRTSCHSSPRYLKMLKRFSGVCDKFNFWDCACRSALMFAKFIAV